MAAHQTSDRSTSPNKASNTAIFDIVIVKKDFVEIDGIRYPRNSVNVDYKTKNYLDQYGHVRLIYIDYAAEKLSSPIVTYLDLKKFYRIQVIGLRYQFDHMTPKKISYLENIEVLLRNLDCLWY